MPREWHSIIVQNVLGMGRGPCDASGARRRASLSPTLFVSDLQR